MLTLCMLTVIIILHKFRRRQKDKVSKYLKQIKNKNQIPFLQYDFSCRACSNQVEAMLPIASIIEQNCGRDAVDKTCKNFSSIQSKNSMGEIKGKNDKSSVT